MRFERISLEFDMNYTPGETGKMREELKDTLTLELPSLML